MAFNWKTFQTRTITAIIFAAVMLVGLLWNHWSFLILFSIIHIGCWWEYLRLIEKIFKIDLDKVIKYLFIFSGFILMIVVGLKNISFDIWTWVYKFKISSKWVIWLCSFFLLLIFLIQNKKVPNKAKRMSLVGFLYISLSCGLILNLYFKEITIHVQDSSGVAKRDFIPIIIIASIWINDTMAYIVGSLIGKTQLSKVSPKKTWEGTIGGIILSVVIIGLLGPYLTGTTLLIAAVVALLSSVFGTIGDLFESKLKRIADVKDSGSFMPGHGGFLDRFDSLLFAIPAVCFFVYYIS